MRVCRTFSGLLLGLAMSAGAQALSTPELPLPATGVDFSGVDQFWRILDVLQADSEPAESQWRALQLTPGYRLAQTAIGDVVRDEFEIAFRPSRRAVFDSLVKLDNDRALDLMHLARAASLRSELVAFRNEGIADLIDKPFPFSSPNPSRAAYAERYNAEYAHAPATLHALDSLLAVVSKDSTQMASAGLRARTLLWSSGHPNGAYIAREIYETFGVDSLFPAIFNPAAFLRTYASAEKTRSKPSPFSRKATRVIELLERRYWVRNK